MFPRTIAMNSKLTAALCFACVIAAGAVPIGQKAGGKTPDPKRPKITLKARPQVGIAPMKTVLTVDLEGGSDDFEEFYCPTVVWEWGDGGISEATNDCEPYQAGKSQIKRRYTVEHVYKRSGLIRVYFSLRHHEKEVAAVGVNITVQPGGSDNSQ
jgi:hypothetical protein